MSWEGDGLGFWTGKYYVDGVLEGTANQSTNASVTSAYSAVGQLWNTWPHPSISIMLGGKISSLYATIFTVPI